MNNALKITARLSSWSAANKEMIEAWCTVAGYDAYEPEEGLRTLFPDIERKLEAGWSPSDIYKFMTYTEELDPRLSEEVALKRMKALAG